MREDTKQDSPSTLAGYSLAPQPRRTGKAAFIWGGAVDSSDVAILARPRANAAVVGQGVGWKPTGAAGTILEWLGAAVTGSRPGIYPPDNGRDRSLQ